MAQTKQCCDECSLDGYYSRVIVLMFLDFQNGNVLLEKDEHFLALPSLPTSKMSSWEGNCPDSIRNSVHESFEMTSCIAERAYSRHFLASLTDTPVELYLLHSTVGDPSEIATSLMYECVVDSESCDSPKDFPLVADASYEWASVHGVGSRLGGGDRWKNVRDEEAWRCIEKVVLGLREEVLPGKGTWEKAGWFQRVFEKSRSVLLDLGYKTLGRMEQHHVESHSIVLMIRTNKGMVFFKMSHINEGAVMRFLAQYAPNMVPVPLYVDEEGWMLIKDLGEAVGVTRMECDWLKVEYAKLQKVMMDHLDELKEIGIPVSTAESLTERMCAMLEDGDVRTGLQRIGCKVMERSMTEVRDFIWRCMKFGFERGVPISLVHGDWAPCNVIRSDEREDMVWLIDWECATIDLAFKDARRLERLNNVVLDESDRYYAEFIGEDKVEWGEAEESMLHECRRSEIQMGHFELNKRTGRRPYLDPDDLDSLKSALEALDQFAKDRIRDGETM